MRALVKLAKAGPSGGWSPSKALAALPQGDAALLGPTIEQYRQRLQPLKSLEPRLDGSLAKSVADAFAPIGAKMRPDMSVEQGGFWATSIVMALSDLPPFIAIAALEEAVHSPWQFPTEMEAGVREIAKRKLEDHQLAIRRLQAMRDEILRASTPPSPQLEAPDTGEPLSREEVAKLLRSPVGKELIRMGLQLGSIRQEDYEAELAIWQQEGVG